MGQLQVKVIPNSSRNQIAGWLGDALKVKVMAAAEKGKANRAVIELLATALSIEPRQLAIISGQTAPAKTIAISPLSDSEIRQRLDSIIR